MWENEIVVLVTSLKKRILADQKKARYSRIAADNAVPPFIKTLFDDQVARFLKEEQPVTVRSTPHFSLSEQDLTHLTGRFVEAFRDTASFSVEEIEETLRTALVLRMDYLVKPIDTMRRLLFNGQKTADQAKIETKLSPFRKVLPYADALVKDFKRLNYREIEADEYGKLINDMLQRLIEPEPVKVALHDFSVLTEFLSETKGEEVQIVEGPLVQEFLADRSLWGFRRAVEVEMKLGKEDFNRMDLEMTIKRYLELKADFSKLDTAAAVQAKTRSASPETSEAAVESFDLTAEPEENSADTLEDAGDTEPGEPSSVNAVESVDLMGEDDADEGLIDLDEIVSAPEDAGGEEPFAIPDLADDGGAKKTVPEAAAAEEESWDLEDVLGESESEPEKAEKVPEPAPETEDTDEEGSLDIPDEKDEKPAKKQMRIIRREKQETESEALDAEKPSPALGLKKLIDKKTEKVFIKKLFGNDEAAYKQLLEKLEESESWRVAKILIDNELFKRDVDPFSREAIKLVDLVYSRYYPEEGVGGT